jgi:hypothetical protein
MLGLRRRLSLGGVALVALATAALLAGATAATSTAAGSPDLIDVISLAGTSSAATAVSVVPMSTSGGSAAVLGAPIALPTAASGSQNPLTESGSAASEGFLNLSGDGRYVTLAGYAATPGTSSVASTTSSSTRRVAARIDGAGNVDTSTALNAFTANNVRSAVSDDGTHMWFGGAGSGDSPKTAVYAATFGATSGTGIVTPSPTGTRDVVIAGGNLYFSTTTTVTPGIYKVGSGLPTSGSQSTTALVTGASLDPYGFALVQLGAGPGVDTLYVADGTAGGITKYSLVGSSWVSKGTVGAGTKLFGLAAKVENGGVQLYATTANVVAGNTVVSFFDSSGAGATISSGSLVTVATAAAGTTYRGVAFGPSGQTLSAGPPSITLADSGLSRSIGDSYDPTQTTATISDAVYPASQLTVTATSDNPAVVPSVAVSGTGSTRTLTVTSNDAVGLANITVTVSTPDGRSASATLQYGVSAAAPDATSNFLYDFSNASTAIDVGGGYYIVGDDEFNQLALYQGGVSGLPVQMWNFDPQMGVADTSQIDIEASARLGNTIYWFGSEGNNSTGDVKANRSILFATTISGSGASTTLTFAGYYKNMRNDLLAWDQANGNQFGFTAGAAQGQIPKEANGFNIEGAEFAAGGSGTLYLGFRAPIVPTSNRTQALVVPVTNLASLISSSGNTGSATFGTPLQWNLTPPGYVNPLGDTSALGIREIRKNADDQYLIIAGSYEEVPAAPSGGAEYLYTWDGNVAHQPVLTNTVLPTPDDGSWETVVSVPDPLTNGSSITMIQDDGDNDLYNTGQEAKDLTAAPSQLQKDRADVLTVSLPAQTVTFASIPPSPAYSGTTYSVSATGGASGNPVSFSIDALTSPGICSVTGSVVHLIGAGTCTVDADEAGSFQYSAGHTTQSFAVIQAPVPVVTVPAEQTVETAAATGAVVTFSASATDVFDGTDPASCAPLSGSLFPLGLTTVTCSATDSHGILGSASFGVNVRLRPDHFRVTFSATSIATGVDFPVTITALDASDHTVTAYQGGATLTDTSGSLSVAGPISWSGGVGTATVTIGTAISRDRVIATDSSFTVPPTGTSTNVLSVTGATLDHFHFSGLPTTFSTTDQVTFQITALDAGSQPITGFSGPLVLSDATGTLNVVSVTWSSGVATVTVSVGSASARDRITAVSGAVSAQSAVFAVTSATLDHFHFSGLPTTFSTTDQVTFQITALDAASQPITAFTGPLVLSDVTGTLNVVSVVWSNGVATVTVSVGGATTRDRITAVSGAVSAQSPVFNVIGPVASLRVTVSPATTVVQEAPATVTVTAVDSAGQVVPGFVGPVSLTDTTGAMTVLDPPVWLAGVGTFDVSFPTTIARDRVIANDGDGQSGTSVVFAVVPQLGNIPV